MLTNIDSTQFIDEQLKLKKGLFLFSIIAKI